MSEFLRDSGNGVAENMAAEDATTSEVALDTGPATVLLSGIWAGEVTLQKRTGRDDTEAWYNAAGVTFTGNGAYRILAMRGFVWRLIFSSRTSGTAEGRIVQ